MLPCVKRPIPRTGTDFLPFSASNGLFHARERCNRMAERVGNLNFARYQNSEPQLSPPCPYNRGYSCCLSLPSSHWSYLFTSPATFPALIVPNHLLESLPPSSATFPPFIVARHLRHPSPTVSGRNHRYIHFLCHTARLFYKGRPVDMQLSIFVKLCVCGRFLFEKGDRPRWPPFWQLLGHILGPMSVKIIVEEFRMERLVSGVTRDRIDCARSDCDGSVSWRN